MNPLRNVATALSGPASTIRISAPRRRLLTLLADIQFGRIQGMVIQNGEPVFEPYPAVVRTLKLGAIGNAHPPLGDPAGRPAVVELFAHFTRIGNGVIHKIQIADGLPLLAEIEEHAHL